MIRHAASSLSEMRPDVEKSRVEPAATSSTSTRRRRNPRSVVHGSQPKFTIPEVLDDMHRAVRFIKANAKKYNIDPDQLGIAGGSAGGHLSLMQGCAPRPGDPDAPDPVGPAVVEGRGGRVLLPADRLPQLRQGPGEVALGDGTLKGFRPPFDFRGTRQGDEQARRDRRRGEAQGDRQGRSRRSRT